ncbi:aminoglycoside phosphotransferase family protein [Nocardiopsis sp. CC223A]|uniref:aminoglycoside phosphotransferase family protein n=1 Tax=Nocardiopsis sp. CC223A TaxID=3044051 RepID=UPI00278C0DE6|nr:aminoglycoside phosphotransferase family protein [Nocardiopsis sp. CC223A]
MPELIRSGLSDPPQGCRDRLFKHYGPSVADWLATVPETLTAVGRRWGFIPVGYHDAGHASVLALAAAPAGERVLLKAWPDPDRCAGEIAALRLWSTVQAARVLEVDGERSVAALSLIGGRPGGGRRPDDDARRVAEVIQAAHEQGRAVEGHREFPELSSFLDQEVRPRVAKRLDSLNSDKRDPLLQGGLRELESLSQTRLHRTVLHGDLYQENTACDEEGTPHLLDPLPMYGDAAFDWAFWIVYYRLGRGTAERLALAAQTSQIGKERLRSWCLATCLDGLLYYLDVGDTRAPAMTRIMRGLSQGTETD